jgi:hypothetical protein
VAFTPTKNPSPAVIRDIISASINKCARRIVDQSNGDHWVWAFEQATHAEGAALLGIPYAIAPGLGDVLFAD